MNLQWTVLKDQPDLARMRINELADKNGSLWTYAIPGRDPESRDHSCGRIPGDHWKSWFRQQHADRGFAGADELYLCGHGPKWNLLRSVACPRIRRCEYVGTQRMAANS